MAKAVMSLSPFSDPPLPITSLAFEPVGFSEAARGLMNVRSQLLVKRFHLPDRLLELSAAIEFFFEHGFHCFTVELVELAATGAFKPANGNPTITIHQPTDRFRALVLAVRAAEDDLRAWGITFERF